jgi:hypothetical protein
MSCLRRSQSVAPPIKRSSHLTGFVRLEAMGTMPQSPSRKRSTSTGSNSSSSSSSSDKALGSRWLYAVLSRDTLRCFARRADHKMQHAPVSELTLDLVPTVEHPKSFTFDHECVYVRCRKTGKAIAIRLHESGKINQWVTALYYAALACSSGMTLSSSAPKNKSVSFMDAPEVSILPVMQEPIDKDELFYSKKDYAEFLQRWKDDVVDGKTAAVIRIGERCK